MVFIPQESSSGTACTTSYFSSRSSTSSESTTWPSMKKIWARNKKEWMRFGKRIHTWEITIENWSIQSKVSPTLSVFNLSRSFTCWPFSYLDFWIWLLEVLLFGLIQPKQSELLELDSEIQINYKTNLISSTIVNFDQIKEKIANNRLTNLQMNTTCIWKIENSKIWLENFSLCLSHKTI